VILSEQDRESNEFTRISVENLLFPITFFLGFAIFGIILQLYHHWSMGKQEEEDKCNAAQNTPCSMRKNNVKPSRRLIGRSSTLHLFTESGRAMLGRSSSLSPFAGPKKTGRALNLGKQEDEDSCHAAQNIPSSMYHDKGSESNPVVSVLKGSGLSDFVHLDGFHDNVRDQIATKKVSFPFDTTTTDNGAILNGEDNVALLQLDTGVFDKLDELLACYQTMKRRKELVGTNQKGA